LNQTFAFSLDGLVATIRGVSRRRDGSVSAAVDFAWGRNVVPHVDVWTDAAVRAGFARLLSERTGLPVEELAADLDRMEQQIARTPTYGPYMGSQVGQGSLRAVRLADLRVRHTGNVKWIVEGYIGRGEVGFLAGAGESLKSWSVAHLAAAIDGQFKWLGLFDVDAQRVLFIEQERAANLVYQLNRIEIGERRPLGSNRLTILPPTPLPLSELEAQSSLAELVADFGPDLVIVNALRDVLGRANENSPTDMAALLGPLGRIAESADCCLMLVDHFNKAGMTGLLRGNAAHAGTAQKHNEADFVLIAERPRNQMGRGEGPATVSVTKRRNGQSGAGFAISVKDTADGGVLVRGQVGLRALSSTARLVMEALNEGSAEVSKLAGRLDKSKDTVRQALSELKEAQLVTSSGEPGKPHVYRLTGGPTCESI
jgi:DNA-binding transcriptional ArsR family regulator